MKAYCAKCHSLKEINDKKEVLIKGRGGTKRRAMTGVCSSCGTKMIRVLDSPARIKEKGIITRMKEKIKISHSIIILFLIIVLLALSFSGIDFNWWQEISLVALFLIIYFKFEDLENKVKKLEEDEILKNLFPHLFFKRRNDIRKYWQNREGGLNLAEFYKYLEEQCKDSAQKENFGKFVELGREMLKKIEREREITTEEGYYIRYKYCEYLWSCKKNNKLPDYKLTSELTKFLFWESVMALLPKKQLRQTEI